MIEIGYKYNKYIEKNVPIYIFDKIIFNRIARFICIQRCIDRVNCENKIGIYKDTLTSILNEFPQVLLSNIENIKCHYKSLFLDVNFEKLVVDIKNLQGKFLLDNNNIKNDDYYINNIDLVNLYFEKCMIYFNIIYDWRKRISLNKFRLTLIDDLYYIMDYLDYEKYIKYLMNIKDDDQELIYAIEYGKKIIVDNWVNQLTDVNSYNDGDDFSFLVHIGYDKNVSQTFVSSTLITNNLWVTYSGKEVGLIIDPKTIIAAYAKDVYSDNYALLQEDVIAYTPIPTILSKSHIEDICIKKMQSTYYDGMNEIVTEGFNPLGIVYIENTELESSKKREFKYAQLLDLQKAFPELPTIILNREYYNTKVLKKYVHTMKN